MLKNFSRLMVFGAYSDNKNERREGESIAFIALISIMIKRTPSKKSLSLHKEPSIQQELRSIDNLQLTSQNILEKLLNPANEKKLTLDSKKYHPKFEKKDYETLSQECQALKAELKSERQNVTNLKFRLGEYERKVKFLEGIQEKWQGQMQKEEEARQQSVYTDILKKKIQELNELYLASEEKIKELKQLPHVSVFQETSVEKQYLIKEAIRLKAVIAALPRQDEKVDNKFMKLSKEQNQNLKSVIRLQENDKNLLKSHEIAYKRTISDLRRNIDHLNAVILTKDTQIQTMANQNKNMIFKKAQQFATDQKKKENQEYDALRRTHEALQDNYRQLELEHDALLIEYEKLKKNEKLNETKKSSEDKEKTDLRFDNNRLRKLLEDLREELDRERENAKLIESENKKKRREKKLPTNASRVELYPPVKFEDIELALLTLAHHVQLGGLSIADLFDEEEMRCGRLVDIFAEEPLGLERPQATKLARYIVEGNANRRVAYDQKATASKSLCVMTLKAALGKLEECRSPGNEDIWWCILAKSKKLVPQLQRMEAEVLSKEDFLGVLTRHINESFGGYVNLALLESFDLEASQSEVMLSVGRLLLFFEGIQTHKTNR